MNPYNSLLVIPKISIAERFVEVVEMSKIILITKNNPPHIS